MKNFRYFALIVVIFLSFMSMSLKVTGQAPQLELIRAENANRLEELKIIGHGALETAVISPDGNTLVVGTSAGVWFYDFNHLDAEPFYFNPGRGFTSNLEFDTTGRYLQVDTYTPDVGSLGRTIWYIGDNPTDTQSFIAVTGQALVAGGRYILRENNELWDPVTENIVSTTLPTDDSFEPDLTSLMINANYPLLAVRPTSSSTLWWFKEIRLFDSKQERYVAQLQTDLKMTLGPVVFSRSGDQLLMVVDQYAPTESTTIRAWPVEKLLQEENISLEDSRIIWQEPNSSVMHLTPYADKVLVAYIDHTTHTRSADIVNLSTGQIEERLSNARTLIHPVTEDIITLSTKHGDQWQIMNYSRQEVMGILTDFGSSLHQVQFNADQTQVITINQRGNSNHIEVTVRLRNTDDWHPIHEFHLGNQIDHIARFQPDGRPIIVSISGHEPESPKRVDIWDIATETVLYTFSFEASPRISLSQDGRFLFIAEGNNRWLYDITHPDSPHSLRLPQPILSSSEARFSPEGDHLVLIEFEEEQFLLRLWQIAPPQEITQITHRHIALKPFVDNVQWIDDDRILVLCEIKFGLANSQTTFWNFEQLLNDEYAVPFLTITDSTSCGFEPGPQTDIAIPTRGGIQIWHIATGRTPQTVGKGTQMWWISAAFGPDASVVFGGDYFGHLTAWNADSEEELATFEVTPWGIEQIEFIQDGTVMVIYADDGTLRLWGIPSNGNQ